MKRKRKNTSTKRTLRESEQRLRAIVQTAVDAIITIDERGIIESANPATERLFGYSRAELIGSNVKKLMPEPYRSEHDRYLANYLRTGKAKIIGIGREVLAMRKDGKTFPISLAVSTVPLDDRQLFTGIIHDLSARRRLEQQIIEASTAEQRRIAQDLHDGLCQELVGIAFGADMIARRIGAAADGQAQAVNQLAASVRQAATQARNMSHGLNPVDLNAGGLATALANLAVRMGESFGITCKFHWDGVAEVNDGTTATQLYRIAQEAINNAIRHGKSRRIEITFSAANQTLKLSIVDHGSGFQIPEVRRAHPHIADEAAAMTSGGIGLATMRYRANMIGAIFDIQSRVGRGTEVSVAVCAGTAAKKDRRAKQVRSKLA